MVQTTRRCDDCGEPLFLSDNPPHLLGLCPMCSQQVLKVLKGTQPACVPCNFLLKPSLDLPYTYRSDVTLGEAPPLQNPS